MFQKLVFLKNGQRICIRSFLISDFLLLHKMYSSLSEESKKFFHPSFLEFTDLKWFLGNLALLLSTSFAFRRFIVYLWPKAVSFSFVAVNAQNELVGFVYLRLEERLVNDSYTSAVGICVRDYFQSAGLGSHLLGLIIALAKKRKIREIFSWVLSENIRSIRLFQKYGFKSIRLVKRGTRWRSRYYDCLEMCRRLF